MNPFAAGAAWVGGEVVPVAEAGIPILDTGFTRSDLTYDVVSVWDGAFFRLDDHLERFERNCRRIQLTSPLDRAEQQRVLTDLVVRTGLREAYVAMVVTRGIPPVGERDPRKFENRYYAYVIPFVWVVRPELQKTGIHLAIARETFRVPPGAFDPTVKNFMWGDMIRGLYEGYDRGAYTAVLTDGAGHVTEGAGYNLFALADGTWHTPGEGVFDGITRRTVLELCDELGLPSRVGPLDVATLERADEVFLCTTAGGVMPVTTLEGTPIGDGTPGPSTTRLRDAYWAAHEDPARRTEVPYAG